MLGAQLNLFHADPARGNGLELPRCACEIIAATLLSRSPLALAINYAARGAFFRLRLVPILWQSLIPRHAFFLITVLRLFLH